MIKRKCSAAVITGVLLLVVSRKSGFPTIANDKLQRCEFKDHSLQLTEEINNASMGSPKVFSDFMSRGLNDHPADRNILLIWDHGSNTVQGVCYDENYGTHFLLLPDIRIILAEIVF